MFKLKVCLLKALILIFGSLPLRVQYANARVIAWIIGSVVRYRRDDVLINLSRSFPDQKYKEIRSICKDFYRHFADLLVETFWFGASSSKRLARQHIVEIVNPEEMQRLYDIAPSVMNMYSHAGNWELLGGLPYYNYSSEPWPLKPENTLAVYKRLSSRAWDAVIRDNRLAPLPAGDHSDCYVESADIVRFIFRHRAEKRFYNINTDQSPYRGSTANAAIRFMHQDTLTMTAAAALAHKFGFAVTAMSMRRAGRGLYKIEYHTICEDASTMSVEDIVARYYSLLEADINAQPENYLWTHRRWKIRMNQ